MTRQEKYPDTKYFHYYNANPKNRITGDCTYRAISTATGIPYNTVVMEMAELHCETGYAADSLIDRYMKSKGWTKHKQPRKANNTKYTGKEFCQELLAYDSQLEGDFDFHNIVANIGGHHIVAIVEGRVYDIWDSTNACIGNLWTR